MSKDRRTARRWTRERCQNPERGRLSGTIRAEQPKNGTALNGKAEVVDGSNLFVRGAWIHFHQMVNGNGRVGHGTCSDRRNSGTDVLTHRAPIKSVNEKLV